MAFPTVHHMAHSIKVDAPAKSVYDLIVDSANWPNLFKPTCGIEHFEKSETGEKFQIWASANGDVKTWQSVRTFDAEQLHVGFRQVKSSSPLKLMGGEWLIRSLSENETLLVLTHYFIAEEETEEKVNWIATATDNNSQSEIASIKALAESGLEEKFMTFEDTVYINAEVEDVYNFIYEGKKWEERIAHVAKMTITEDLENVQVMEMDTYSPDGSTHTTKSVRLCFPYEKITYKQVVTPKLMDAHTGKWSFVKTAEGVKATSRHDVIMRTDTIKEVLGEDATLDDAKKYVKHALSNNSLKTLGYAKSFCETGVVNNG